MVKRQAGPALSLIPSRAERPGNELISLAGAELPEYDVLHNPMEHTMTNPTPTRRRQVTRIRSPRRGKRAAAIDLAAENARMLREDIYRLLDTVGDDLDYTFGRGRWEQVRCLEALRLALMRLHNEVRGLPPDDAGSLIVMERCLTAQRR